MKQLFVLFLVVSTQSAQAAYGVRDGHHSVGVREDAVSQAVISETQADGSVASCRVDLRTNADLVPHFLTLSTEAQADLSEVAVCDASKTVRLQADVHKMDLKVDLASPVYVATGVVVCVIGLATGAGQAALKNSNVEGVAGLIVGGATGAGVLLNAGKLIPALGMGLIAGACTYGGSAIVRFFK